MSKHEVLFSITEDARDGINFQVKGSEVNFIVNKKEDVLAVMDRLRNALVNETYPFKPFRKESK
ncbi:hypothetical protein CPT_Moonbeam107 [Bacillus phage Moonbeam]|uniref:Uncharacterized protein n=1 Tax=Bacillus phage Moonbeam TaxID=1540091 RepID=A0A0A0RN64_9CAUD|nr:hypothetical protein CPT_Moonbeam107 [Bacillus phage Moonbeam]AIW03505.1 hypothetical protein CPT_Moonbeam107 [Bacillus phage Moonbeam]